MVTDSPRGLGELSALRDRYQGAAPFPHVVLDNFLHPRHLRQIREAFPSPTTHPWYRYDNVFEKKLASNRFEHLPERIVDLMFALNAPSIVTLFEGITGIVDLIPDDGFRGGGCHCIPQGGKLDIHADYNVHPDTGLHRRLNAILFLNDDWQPGYAGELEFWDAEMRAAVQCIPPLFNRLVLFEVTDKSFHGHPEPLRGPPTFFRKSMAWYYYTAERPPDEIGPPHSTLYQRRPGDPLDDEVEELRRVRGRGRLRDDEVRPDDEAR